MIELEASFADIPISKHSPPVPSAHCLIAVEFVAWKAAHGSTKVSDAAMGLITSRMGIRFFPLLCVGLLIYVYIYIYM